MQARTRGELISQVRNELRLVNSDSTLTEKFIWSIIQKHAAWLIKRESTKLDLVTQEGIFQTKKCVDVEYAPAADDCCGIKSRCKVFRTVHKLPEIYEDDNGPIIKSVFTIDGSADFYPIKIYEYQRKLENPHMIYDKSAYVFYNNGYLYFPKSTIRKVMVKAYFTEEVVNDCEPCSSDEPQCLSKLDQSIRLPEYILGELMQNVLNELASLTIKIPADENINKNENIKN